MAPMRSMPPTFPRPARARSRAGCRRRPTPIFRRSPIHPAWSIRSKPVELSMLTNRARSDGEWSTTIQPKAKTNIVPTGIGKFGFSILRRRLVRCADRGKPQRVRRRPGDVPADRDHAHQSQRRLAVGPQRRSALSALRHRLRLEVHRYLAVDHRSLWPGGPIG